MDVAQLILEVLILIGIFYVVFIQDRATKIKNSLLKTLKEYPEAAEAFIRMERKRIREETEREYMEGMRAVLNEVSDVRQEDKEKLSRWISGLSSLLGKIFRAVGPNPLFEKFIEEMEYNEIKRAMKIGYSMIKTDLES